MILRISISLVAIPPQGLVQHPQSMPRVCHQQAPNSHLHPLVRQTHLHTFKLLLCHTALLIAADHSSSSKLPQNHPELSASKQDLFKYYHKEKAASWNATTTHMKTSLAKPEQKLKVLVDEACTNSSLLSGPAVDHRGYACYRLVLWSYLLAAAKGAPIRRA